MPKTSLERLTQRRLAQYAYAQAVLAGVEFRRRPHPYYKQRRHCQTVWDWAHAHPSRTGVRWGFYSRGAAVQSALKWLENNS